MNKVPLFILYKLASRSRPKRFIETINNIRFNTSHWNYIILCTLDADDPTMNNPEMLKWIKETDLHGRIWYNMGNSKSKIDAINRGMQSFLFPWDVLVNMSDDMRFTAGGFDHIILNDLFDNFPNGDAAVQYNDGGKESKDLMTLSVMGRKYYERTNYIYHPDYESVYCDNEATEVAELLGRLVRSKHQILCHEHPAHGKADNDALYAKNEHPKVHARDKATYERRKANNFDLNLYK